MTASPAEDQRAGQAQAAGEAAAAAHEAATQAQHRTTTGSDLAVEQASTANARPSLSPSEPPPVGQYENHGPPAA